MTDALEPLALIVAVSRNGVIGRDGGLPWHLSEDLKFFKRVTTGHAVIMGRRTHESIGKPLVNRRNIVVTRDPKLTLTGCEIAHSLDGAIALARTTDREPVVIGGAALYTEALPRVTRLYLTEVHREVAGDTFFPALDRDEWSEVERIDQPEFSWVTLARKGSTAA
jgi:dihydrofolate reductase